MKIEIDMTAQEWTAVTDLLNNISLNVIEDNLPKSKWNECFNAILQIRDAVSSKVSK